VVQPALNKEALGPSHSGITVPSSAEEMLQNTLVNPTTGLPSGRLVTRPKELSIIFKTRCIDKMTASLTINYGKKTVKRKWKKQNIIRLKQVCQGLTPDGLLLLLTLLTLLLLLLLLLWWWWWWWW
jgi:hypothetical protein